MSDFDDFSTRLLEEAKRFMEKASEATDDDGKQAFLHAALLIGVSSLEACINSIADDLLTREDIPLLERGLLAEKEIKLVSGKFELTSQLKMSRTVDRIEYIYRKFTNGSINGETWWGDLNQCIHARNDIVHPKKVQLLSINFLSKSLEAIINCINRLYLVIYKKGLPSVGRGLTSKLNF